MEKLLEALLEGKPDGIAAQLVVGVASQFNGAIRRTEYPGIYEVLSVGQHPKTGALMPFKSYFEGKAVIAITPLTAEQIESVQQPGSKSGLVIPGRPH